MEKSNFDQEEEHHRHDEPEPSCGCGCFRVFRFKPLRTREPDSPADRRRQGQLCGEGTAVSWLCRVRELSEIVAGPKWKNFIRRVGAYCRGTRKVNKARFHYDPESYALNFDSGNGRDQQDEQEQEQQQEQEEEQKVLLR